MPNTIPPLVCNTPPPIDDLDSDEDLSAPNDNFDQFDGDNCIHCFLSIAITQYFHANISSLN